MRSVLWNPLDVAEERQGHELRIIFMNLQIIDATFLQNIGYCNGVTIYVATTRYK